MRRLFLLTIIAGVAAFAWGFGLALRTPDVARYRIVVPGLERPLRIAQLSDTHGSRFDMPPERLARIVAQVNALRPDLIVLTGDYIKGYPPEWTPAEARAVLRPFGQLRAPLGVFAVLGNHDSPGLTRAGLAGTGVRLLIGAAAAAGPVTIVGSDDLLRSVDAIPSLRRSVAAAPPGKPIIVIAHEPEVFQWLPRRATLLIAGHTHGGQIVLPLLGTLSHGAFNDSHLRGLFREHGQTLVVSSGVGTSVLPLRVGVPPEIVEIALVPG